MDLSIIIVNWNTCRELRNCLASVERDNTGNMEVIVVDNASSDNSRQMVKDEFAQVHLIENTANVGFAKGSNTGISISRGRYVLLLNPDSEVQQGSFNALIRFGDENPQAGIFGLKVLNSDGTIQHSCRKAPTLGAVLFRNSVMGRLFPNNPYTREYLMASWDHDKIAEIDWVSGAALVMRRELIDDIGILDERFYMYCEDMDLGYRARQSGWKVMYFPGAVVVHAKGRSSDKDPNRMIIEHHKSMYRYFMKHNAGKASILMTIAVPLGLGFRAGILVSANFCRHIMWRLRHRKGVSSSTPVTAEKVHSDSCVKGSSNEE
ncbi:MAG: glycosyltransferase family 2 protein [Armatimonadota bacterium]